MRAVVYDGFGLRPELRTVEDPAPPPDGAVIAVTVTGICRSDWHAWRGHDREVRVPHVGGHELAGRVAAVGERVTGWRGGERVTVPFVCGCGTCRACLAGQHQVCERQTQPGFTHWGSYAEYVVIQHADLNLVGLPDDVDDASAALLGCRFATAYRAVVAQGAVRAGEWVVVHGCGGAGLSAVMIAAATGGRVIAVDVSDEALDRASAAGAVETVDSRQEDPVAAVHALTGGGAAVSLDCVGDPTVAAGSVACLGTRGRHVQLGLLPPADGPTALPMELVVAKELAVLGSHGLSVVDYPALLALVEAGTLRPGELVGRRIGLSDIPDALAVLDGGPDVTTPAGESTTVTPTDRPTRPAPGVTVVDVAPPTSGGMMSGGPSEPDEPASEATTSDRPV